MQRTERVTDEMKLRTALQAAVDTIQDYLSYTHDGDPWKEDARAMGEMDINDYGQDGRLAYALNLLSAPSGEEKAVEVAVKPLEWDFLRAYPMRARSIVGDYTVWADHPRYYVDGPSGFRSNKGSVAAAKAAAQQDYETRIRSALVDVPAVESEPVGKPDWHRSDSTMGGTLLYTLREDGWRKGAPLMVNDVTIRIDRAGGSHTDVEPIIRTVLRALSTRKGSADGSASVTKGCAE